EAAAPAAGGDPRPRARPPPRRPHLDRVPRLLVRAAGLARMEGRVVPALAGPCDSVSYGLARKPPRPRRRSGRRVCRPHGGDTVSAGAPAVRASVPAGVRHEAG